MKCLAVALYGTFLSMSAHAFEDTWTIGQGKLDIEINAERQVEHGESQLTSDLQLSYGATDTLDLYIEFPYQLSPAPSGWQDSAAAFKWRFYQQSDVSLALVAGVNIPSEFRRQGITSADAGLAAQWESDAFSVYANLAYEYQDSESRWGGILAAESEISPAVSITTEYAYTHSSDSLPSEKMLIFSLDTSLTDHLDLSLSYTRWLTAQYVDQIEASLTLSQSEKFDIEMGYEFEPISQNYSSYITLGWHF